MRKNREDTKSKTGQARRHGRYDSAGYQPVIIHEPVRLLGAYAHACVL